MHGHTIAKGTRSMCASFLRPMVVARMNVEAISHSVRCGRSTVPKACRTAFRGRSCSSSSSSRLPRLPTTVPGIRRAAPTRRFWSSRGPLHCPSSRTITSDQNVAGLDSSIEGRKKVVYQAYRAFHRIAFRALATPKNQVEEDGRSGSADEPYEPSL